MLECRMGGSPSFIIGATAALFGKGFTSFGFLFKYLPPPELQLPALLGEALKVPQLSQKQLQ